MTVITLISANQYSDSPNALTDNRFSSTISPKNSRLQPQGGIKRIGSQYVITSAAMEISAATVITQLNQ